MLSAGRSAAEFAQALGLPEIQVAEAAARGRRDRPWFLDLVAGLGGWLAAVVAAVGVGLLLEDEEFLAWAGGAFIAVAVLAGRKAHGPFARQFVVAVALTGQSLLAFGLTETLEDILVAALVICAISVPLIRHFADPAHEFATAFGVAVFLGAGLDEHMRHVGDWMALSSFVGAGLLLDPPRRDDHRAAAVGLVSALLVYAFADPQSWFASFAIGLPGKALVLAAAAWPAFVLWRQRERSAAEGRAWAAAAAMTAVLGVVLPAGLAVGLLLGLLGRAVASWPLALFGLGVGGAALLHYYYDLRMDLLAKSGLLAAAGLCMMAVWLAWRRATAEAGR